MPSKLRALGNKAEELAENFLLAQNYKILARNYYNKNGYQLGEIDLVAENSQGVLIFIEVKARSSRFEDALPTENLTKSKIMKLYKIIDFYLIENNFQDRRWRLDAILVNFDFKNRKSTIRQLKSIRP